MIELRHTILATEITTKTQGRTRFGTTLNTTKIQ